LNWQEVTALSPFAPSFISFPDSPIYKEDYYESWRDWKSMLSKVNKYLFIIMAALFAVTYFTMDC
jgi:hypothetical protein